MEQFVVNVLLDNLSKLLYEDVELIGPAESEFLDLLGQVQILNTCLLEVAEIEKRGTQRLKEEVSTLIATAVCRTEDVIDKFLVHRMLDEDKHVLARLFNCDGRSRSVNNLSVEIKGLLDKMTVSSAGIPVALPATRKNLLVANALREIVPEKFEKPKNELNKPLLFEDDRWTYFGPPETRPRAVDPDELVGFKEEENQLIGRLLTRKRGDVAVIPIVGMVGIGKTTLAAKVCNHSELTDFYFDLRFWISVGKSFDERDLCLEILKQYMQSIKEYEDKDLSDLTDTIRRYAMGKRCLIVLDDVWTSDIVDLFMKIFPKTCILMTTRIGQVAFYASANPLFLNFLTVHKSFKILEKALFRKLGVSPDELVEFRKSIAKICNGVPLFLVTIAEELLHRHRSQKEWRFAEEEMLRIFLCTENNTPESVYNKIKKSYDHLTQDMKLCFLFFGVFPRGFDIPVWKLVRLWIAEGLIKCDSSSSSLEETAEIYLNSLVDMNLVMVKEKSFRGHIKTCRVHDLLHEFCKLKAKEWLFKQVYDEDSAIPETARLLSIESSVLKKFLSTKRLAEHVKSFYCFPSKDGHIQLPGYVIRRIPKAFPLIRVLDVESHEFPFSKEFNQLFHLRYISISGKFKALPKAFAKFWNLQTLIVNTSTSNATLEIEANIWKLLRLRHLLTNIPAKLPPPPKPTSKDSCLQTLSVVAPASFTKDVFAKAYNLKKLGIRGNMKAFLETSNGGWRNLEELKFLEILKLYNDDSCPPGLHLPPSVFKFLCTLKKLTLSNTRFEWNEAKILGKLECLEVLKLKHNAFIGVSWSCTDFEGFSQLQVLWIERAEFKTWEASVDYFPILRQLVLIDCENLEALPKELAHGLDLQEMRLENTSKAVKSAKAIQCDIKEMQGINKLKLSIFPPDTDFN